MNQLVPITPTAPLPSPPPPANAPPIASLNSSRRRSGRHRGYKITPTDYDKAARALLLTLEEFLAEDFTPEIRHAWLTVYGTIALTMAEAAED